MWLLTQTTGLRCAAVVLRSGIAWRRLPLAAIAACAVVLLGSATPAVAHAAFTSSSPEPGTQLTSAPGVVTVRFSEPLILDLSSLRVTDPDGRVWERTSAGEREMSASLDTTAQGVYVVEWKTVSPLDGHTLRGSFRFGVGVTPEDTEAAATVEPDTSDVLLAVGRAVEYGALLLGWRAVRPPSSWRVMSGWRWRSREHKVSPRPSSCPRCRPPTAKPYSTS